MNLKTPQVVIKEAGKKERSIKFELGWLEPAAWVLTNLQWSQRFEGRENTVAAREQTTSWVEMACIFHLLTGKAVGPNEMDYATGAQIAKEAMTQVAKGCQILSGGKKIQFKAFQKPMTKAGANTACGLPLTPGINRRPMLNKYPGLARGVATMLKFAANSKEGLKTKMPVLSTFRTSWKPSGLVETHEQLQQKRAERRKGCEGQKDVLKPDLVQRTPTIPKKRRRGGLCTFGYADTSRSDRSGPLWYAVPNPPPLAGLTAGETLCAKCHDWLVRNKRRRVRRGVEEEAHEDAEEPKEPPRQAHFKDLQRRADLNGKAVEVITGPDEMGKFLVTLKFPDGSEGVGTLRVDTKNLSFSSLQRIHGLPISGRPDSCGEHVRE